MTSATRRLLCFLFVSLSLPLILACGGTAATKNALVSTQVAVASPTAIPTAAPAHAVTDRVINLRSGPGTDYSVVRKLPVDTSVELIAFRGVGEERWYKVQVGDTEGWISATVIDVDSAVADALPVNRETLALPVQVERVEQPVVAPSGGRTGAICRDGTRSSATGRGACSHHDGVAQWLYDN